LTAPPLVTILIPVHNEAAIAEPSLARLVAECAALQRPVELLLCENGSTDGTAGLLDAFARAHPCVRVEHLPDADYGRALKHGIAEARAGIVIIFNMDFWSIPFAVRALELLADYDVVIGSKTMHGARDQRPIVRRLITRGFNGLLRLLFGFDGTDTHGLKAVHRDRIAPIAAACVTDRSIFDTELVLRAQHRQLRITEIPVDVRELRQPSYASVAARAPEAVWNVLKLLVALGRLRR
jgi:glycosyltransferase involved in cell wall biosynthesis